MLIKIIDIKSNEYLYNLDNNLFTYFFSWIEQTDINNYLLSFGNKIELDLDSKVQFFNIFNEIKDIDIYKLSIEKENGTILFDSELYNLNYKFVEYSNEYGALGPSNIIESLDQNKIIFTFNEGVD